MHLDLIVLPSAVRTTSTNVFFDIHDYLQLYPKAHIVAAQVVLNITNAPSGTSMRIRLHNLELGNGTYFPVRSGSTQTTEGVSGFVTGLDKGGSPGSLEGVISQKFRIRAEHDNANAVTYSVSMNLIISV